MRAAAEAEAEAEVVAERPSGEAISISSRDPQASQQRRAFLERVHEQDAAVRDKYEAKMAVAQSQREAAFVIYLRRFWKDATWMVAMPAFPDGRPLREQNPHHLDLWNIFMGAINRRMYGDKGDQDMQVGWD